MQSQRLQELEEVSKELLKVLASDWAGGRLRRSLDRRSLMDANLLDLQAKATQMGQELARTEEEVAKVLLKQEKELQSHLQRAQELEEELVEVQGTEAKLQEATNALRQELEELQEQNQQLEEEMKQEDSVPSAAYITQLYYKLSHIEWDYEAEPSQIKGIHYGPAIAQPFAIASSCHSRCFISDYLWSLVPTTW